METKTGIFYTFFEISGFSFSLLLISSHDQRVYIFAPASCNIVLITFHLKDQKVLEIPRTKFAVLACLKPCFMWIWVIGELQIAYTTKMSHWWASSNTHTLDIHGSFLARTWSIFSIDWIWIYLATCSLNSVISAKLKAHMAKQLQHLANEFLPKSEFLNFRPIRKQGEFDFLFQDRKTKGTALNETHKGGFPTTKPTQVKIQPHRKNISNSCHIRLLK